MLKAFGDSKECVEVRTIDELATPNRVARTLKDAKTCTVRLSNPPTLLLGLTKIQRRERFPAPAIVDQGFDGKHTRSKLFAKMFCVVGLGVYKFDD